MGFLGWLWVGFLVVLSESCVLVVLFVVWVGFLVWLCFVVGVVLILVLVLGDVFLVLFLIFLVLCLWFVLWLVFLGFVLFLVDLGVVEDLLIFLVEWGVFVVGVDLVGVLEKVLVEDFKGWYCFFDEEGVSLLLKRLVFKFILVFKRVGGMLNCLFMMRFFFLWRLIIVGLVLLVKLRVIEFFFEYEVLIDL